jgi:hypothetical protein
VKHLRTVSHFTEFPIENEFNLKNKAVSGLKCTSSGEHLPGKCKARSTNPRTAKIKQSKAKQNKKPHTTLFAIFHPK